MNKKAAPVVTSPRQFIREKFTEYSDYDCKIGLSIKDFQIFGHREPSGYKKVRLISKIQQ